jgi:MFS family permease
VAFSGGRCAATSIDPVTQAEQGPAPAGPAEREVDRAHTALTALLTGIAALVAGQGLLNTTVALSLEAHGTARWLLVAVLACYFLGWVAGCIFVPRLLRRVGHIRTFTALAASTGAAALLHTLIAPSAGWALLRFVSGFCFAGILLTVENWLALFAPPGQRGRVLSRYLLIYFIALSAGQFLLTATGIHGHVPYVSAALLLAVASVPIASTRTEAPQVPEATYMSAGRLLETARAALFTAVVSGLLFGGYQTLGPVCMRRLGLDASQAGQWMGAVIIGGLLWQWPMGQLSDRLDRRLLTLVVCVALVVVSTAAYAFGDTYALLLALGALFGSFVALLYPLALAHGNDRVAPQESLAMGTTLVLVAGTGALVGPLLAAGFMALLGPRGLFVYFACAAGGLAIFCAARKLVRRAPPSRHVEPYVASMRTTAAAVQLDPRVPESEIPLLAPDES